MPIFASQKVLIADIFGDDMTAVSQGGEVNLAGCSGDGGVIVRVGGHEGGS